MLVIHIVTKKPMLFVDQEMVWDFNINEKNGVKKAVLSNEELQKTHFLTIHENL